MRRFLVPCLLCFLFTGFSAPGWLQAQDKASADAASVLPRGQAIYQHRCQSCHGQNGAGTKEVPGALFGDRAIGELADLIDRTMPEGAPEECVGEDARAVAEWMQQAFYSPEAQARLNPPRIELSRLTVSQYRNVVADLSTSFRWQQTPGAERGLNAAYFSGRSHRRERQVLQRVDGQVDFQFGSGSPDGEKLGEDAFAISWDGSLIPRESGWYEFTLRTENGARLYVNDRAAPLIDAWVRSGTDTEFHGRRYLLSGRLYPIKLDWFKFGEKTAAVQLCWKVPGGVLEPIPRRHLCPKPSADVLVVETPFPPDDRSSGYERGTSVSKEWDEATTAAAVEAADRVVATIGDLARLRDGGDRGKKIRDFAAAFVERAFRRPLDDQLREKYIDAQFAAAKTDDEGLRRVVILTLKSPRFLYREATGADDDYDRAARLSFAVLNSLPDQQLLEAAKAGRLNSTEELRRHARRLAADPRARARLLEFLRSWLNLDRLHELDKSDSVYPDFTPELAADLRTSLELALEQAVDTAGGDFRSLLSSNTLFMNGRLAKFYAATLPADAVAVAASAAVESEFYPVVFEPEHRAGLVSHPFLLSGLAYLEASSPIHRGVFVSRGLLGRGVKPPPIAVSPTAPELSPELNTRERVALQTSPEMCVNCHNLINSLGFALENFDAVGRYRSEEKGRPVDASGQYLQRSGRLVRFTGARELAQFLAESEETQRSFVRQLFHHMVQQPVLAWGPEAIDELSDAFAGSQFRMQEQQAETAVRAASRGRAVPAPVAAAVGTVQPASPDFRAVVSDRLSSSHPVFSRESQLQRANKLR
jgi:cytochrome c5